MPKSWNRGADMVKIAMCAHSEEEMAEVYKPPCCSGRS